MAAVLALASILLTAACSQEDWTNRLPYAGPVQIGIGAGEFLPGTDVQYLGLTGEGARVSIGGKETTKKIGDSLDWKGEMVDKVEVDETLRILLTSEDSLETGGTVRIIVTEPQPLAEPVDTNAPVHFELPVGYHVKLNEDIPGTPYTYLGQETEGAHLGNIEGYAYRKLGDSILWEGRLRPGVWLDLEVRTVLITNDQLDVVGTAGLWIQPNPPSMAGR